MSHGRWGSRFPIANLLATNMVFAAVKYRIERTRKRNALKRILRPRDVRVVNDESAEAALRRWLDQGYDKLNVGGGRKNLAGFVNVDFVAQPNVERQVVANITDLSFVPNGSISHIHSNHVIEHLTEADLQRQLRDYHRILAPGGRISIRCPNALGAAYGFWFQPVLEDEREAFIALGFPEDEDFSNPLDTWAHKDLFALLHWFYGDMGSLGNEHLNLITPTKLHDYLTSSGFRVLKMAKPEALNAVAIAERAQPA